MSEPQELAIVPKTMTEVQSMAEVLAKSNLLPDALKGKVPDVVVQILAGAELGLAPMAAIRGVYIVQGKPVLSSDTMVALVLGSGLCEYFSCVEETATSVTYETKRKGSPHPQRFTWSDEDTKAAGLNSKENHRLHKRQMRRARAKSALARDVFPDVLAACYAPEEHVDIAPLTSRPVSSDAIDVEFKDVPSDPLAAIDAATSPDELKAVAPRLAKLPEEQKKEARAKYQAKMDALTAQEPAA